MTEDAMGETSVVDVLKAVVVLIAYFLPAINAYSKRHRSRGMILIINLLAGWTLIGWLLLLGWSWSSAKDDTAPRDPKDCRPCPHCAEPILKAAKVCRFCGRDVTPEPRSRAS